VLLFKRSQWPVREDCHGLPPTEGNAGDKNQDEEEESKVSLTFRATAGVAQQKAIPWGQKGFSLFEVDYQVIQQTAIDAIQLMSNQCTNYDLAVFLSLKGVVCITLRCCLIQSGTNHLVVLSSSRLLLSWWWSYQLGTMDDTKSDVYFTTPSPIVLLVEALAEHS
jgi:hypothetical protein